MTEARRIRTIERLEPRNVFTTLFVKPCSWSPSLVLAIGAPLGDLLALGEAREHLDARAVRGDAPELHDAVDELAVLGHVHEVELSDAHDARLRNDEDVLAAERDHETAEHPLVDARPAGARRLHREAAAPRI